MTALNDMTREQLLALVAQMSAAPVAKLSCKVSPKGAVSLYGLGKWPVTLYRTQWERLFAAQADIEAFIATNAALLAAKPAKGDSQIV